MTTLDPRLHAFRPDLADDSLRGKVDATSFVKAETARVSVPVATIYKKPDAQAMQLSQALFGEACSVFERRAGFAWVQLKHDGYVGYVKEQALQPPTGLATHRIANISTWLFEKPDLKSQPATELYLNAQVSVASITGNFATLQTEGSIFAGHLVKRDQFETDFVMVAERFLNTPYYWGGKTRAGIDCSGLVQISLQACGKESLRDSDMQEKTLGVPVADHSKLQRGDLVFWPGHVAIMQSSTQVIHATGHFMKVTSEPLADVIARSDKPISNIRRLSA